MVLLFGIAICRVRKERRIRYAILASRRSRSADPEPTVCEGPFSSALWRGLPTVTALANRRRFDERRCSHWSGLGYYPARTATRNLPSAGQTGRSYRRTASRTTPTDRRAAGYRSVPSAAGAITAICAGQAGCRFSTETSIARQVLSQRLFYLISTGWIRRAALAGTGHRGVTAESARRRRRRPNDPGDLKSSG